MGSWYDLKKYYAFAKVKLKQNPPMTSSELTKAMFAAMFQTPLLQGGFSPRVVPLVPPAPPSPSQSSPGPPLKLEPRCNQSPSPNNIQVSHELK